MKYGSYAFFFRVTEGGRLPVYKGSAFRGTFGHALKKVTCAVRKRDCTDCLLSQRCLYARVFELQPQTRTEDRRRIVVPPHPYVIEPPRTDKMDFEAGEKFDFRLLLFGEFNDYLPYFIYAFQEMGEQGIGSKNNPVKLELEKVAAGKTSIYNGDDGMLAKGDWTESLSLNSEEHPSMEKMTVRMLTPLRLKFENHFQSDLPFHLLARASLRRVSSLFSAFGDGEPDADYRGLVKNAQAVQVASRNLCWLDIRRYSNRQEKEMLIGGMTGTVTYEGSLGPFYPWLKLAEKFHLGKQTSFGLGRISIQATEELMP